MKTGGNRSFGREFDTLIVHCGRQGGGMCTGVVLECSYEQGVHGHVSHM